MELNGIKVKLNNKIGYRLSNSKEDADLNGKPVGANCVSFVKISDCRIYTKDGKQYYDADKVKPIPVVHGGTFYGYGEWKERKAPNGIDVNGELLTTYLQSTVYFVHDGKVYTGSIRRKV